MKAVEEESKGLTSGEDSEEEIGAEPNDLTNSGSIAAKVMPGVYLSTNLITEKNLTLADINIASFTLQIIENMESELTGKLTKLKLKPLLIDPKAELKKQKEAGNSDTLVDYDLIGQIADKARTLHLAYLLDQDKDMSNSKSDDIFDMQGLQNYVDHNHRVEQEVDAIDRMP